MVNPLNLYGDGVLVGVCKESRGLLLVELDDPWSNRSSQGRDCLCSCGAVAAAALTLGTGFSFSGEVVNRVDAKL